MMVSNPGFSFCARCGLRLCSLFVVVLICISGLYYMSLNCLVVISCLSSIFIFFKYRMGADFVVLLNFFPNLFFTFLVAFKELSTIYFDW